MLFQEYKKRLYTWTSPDGQHQNQIDYILCSQRWITSIQSAKTRPGVGCGSDHELLIEKFRLKLKKVEKIIKLTMLSKEALQIAKKRREAKAKGEKERYTHLNAEFQRIARRDKKAFLSE